MKVADVRYTGRLRYVRRRAPSGEEYVWSTGTRTGDGPAVAIKSIRDAEYFEGIDAFEVTYTGVGTLASEVEAPATGAEAMLADMAYRQKQRLAKRLGVNAGGTDEELTNRLQQEVEELADELEDLE